MKAKQPSLLQDEAFALREWLRRRLRGEALSQLAEALVFFGIGALVVAALALVPMAVLFLNFDLQHIPGLFLATIAVYAIIGELSIIGARVTESSGSPVWQILFSGGTQLITAGQALRKVFRAWRLSRRDIGQVAEIVLWVFKQGRKARTREICAALPDVNVVRILPQLKEMPGVIWLTHHHEVIILSRVLRRELADLLKHVPAPPPLSPEEEDGPFETHEETFEPHHTPNSEVIEWYRALDLPPFSTLEKVKRRYRQLVKIHHPDAHPEKQGSPARASEERIRQINAAYSNIVRNSGGN